MSTKSRQTIYGSRIQGAEISAKHARKVPKEAIREADRAEAEAWSIRLFLGGPDEPSATIEQALLCGCVLLEIKCWHCSHGDARPR